METRAAPRAVDGFVLFQDDSRMAGHWCATGEVDLEAAVHGAYRRLLELTDGFHLYRIWNFVPRINAVDQGLENYRRFCRGRSIAFEEHFRSGFQQHLPSASAVGSTGSALVLAFVAGRTPPRHYENPAQTPAFEYPPQYGPRPPSFARATAVDLPGARQIFISGTAAIRDHRTVGAGDFDAQVTCTVENLRLIAATSGAGEDLGAGRFRRSFRIYLRHESDLAVAQSRLDRELLRPGDTVQFVQADICRAELMLEIEATLTGSPAV
ncbi:MAG TPA: hypothetical protein VHE61_20760 [Opitutaceae bacterium]|nr:hypothetical protein [Opitutaceae bacterium]